METDMSDNKKISGRPQRLENIVPG